MTSLERTARWVQAHSPTELQFYPPSSPIVQVVPPPSDVESSHSVPPRMVIRYGNGKPDVMISPTDHTTPSPSTRNGTNTYSPSEVPPHNSRRSRGESHGHHTTISSHQHDHREHHSQFGADTARSSEHHTPSNALHENSSHPRAARSYRPSSHYSPVQPTYTPQSPYVQGPPLVPQGSVPGPQPSFSKSKPSPWYTQVQPTYAPQSHYVQGPSPQVPQRSVPGPQFSKSKPSPWYTEPPVHRSQRSQYHEPTTVIIAPEHHSKSRYSPPAVYLNPPQTAPNVTGYPPVHAPSPPMIIVPPSPPSGRKSRHNRPSGRRSRSPSPSECESNGSGDTYYVLPAAGQKVHIIPNNRANGTSTPILVKANRPASNEKPFYKQLFKFAERFWPTNSSKAPSGSGRRRQRRSSY